MEATTNRHNDFCIFILTHGRADNVITYRTLIKSGCTYPIYFVIDNEDKQGDQYRDNFGSDKVIMFDKKAMADQTDEGDNFDDRRTITHARNACFDIAKSLGFKYFLELDDDYFYFATMFDGEAKYQFSRIINGIDIYFGLVVDMMKSTKMDAIALIQGGDVIGGEYATNMDGIKMLRKAMNSFFMTTERPVKFVSRMNEDVCTYVRYGMIGKLFGSVNCLRLEQPETQANAGGITEMYKDYGTYVKSFYTVMFAPSCTKIAMMGNSAETARMHHNITWKYAVPKILSEGYKKS